jgi:hypothetical protein
MTEKKNKEKVPNYIIIQWEGKDPPRVNMPKRWVKQEKRKAF